MCRSMTLAQEKFAEIQLFGPHYGYFQILTKKHFRKLVQYAYLNIKVAILLYPLHAEPCNT